MRPLPRLHAITDDAILADADVGIRAGAIAAAGPAVALHVRGRNSSAAFLSKAATRLGSLASPAEAAVFINARPDLAQAIGAQGVQLGSQDLSVPDARRVFPVGWIGRSVHSVTEALEAIDERADYLLLGAVFATPSHLEQPGLGLGVLAKVVALGTPVVAIGGITPERAQEVKDAGAWGVAAVRALWHSADPYAAAMTMLEPWGDGDEAP